MAKLKDHFLDLLYGFIYLTWPKVSLTWDVNDLWLSTFVRCALLFRWTHLKKKHYGLAKLLQSLT